MSGTGDAHRQSAEPVEEGREISWMGLDREWAPQLPTEDFGKGIDFD
jgi:hypothetical protein